MPEYTPTTDEIREYIEAGGEPRFWDTSRRIGREGKEAARAAAFDRWLAARDRENRAIGWDEAVDHVEPALGQPMKRAAHADNPYRGDKT